MKRRNFLKLFGLAAVPSVALASPTKSEPADNTFPAQTFAWQTIFLNEGTESVKITGERRIYANWQNRGMLSFYATEDELINVKYYSGVVKVFRPLFNPKTGKMVVRTIQL